MEKTYNLIKKQSSFKSSDIDFYEITHDVKKIESYIHSQGLFENDFFSKYLFEKSKSTNKEKKIQFLSTETIYAQILDFEEDYIVLNCLIDEKSMNFENRQFDIEPFKELNLQINDYLEIKILTQTGKRIFEFAKIEKDLSHLFKKNFYFSNFKNSPFFQPVIINNEDNF